MKIGYACLNLSLAQRSNHRCILKNATPANLRTLIKKNLQGLKVILEYNSLHGILLYRITSDIIPFASHPVNQVNWVEEFSTDLEIIKHLIKSSSITVSMHPGQYTVINSPKLEVVENSIRELEYHCRFLDSITDSFRHKIVLHAGGAYGNKKSAIKRFSDVCRHLPGNLRQRLVIENDDRVFHIADILDIHFLTGLPVVFDYFHHQVNPPDKQDHRHWIESVLQTWQPVDGIPKIHYSDQFPFKSRGYHALQINMLNFFAFVFSLEDRKVNIMLESKDKNLSAERALCILSNNKTVLHQELERCRELLYCRNLQPVDWECCLQRNDSDFRTFFTDLHGAVQSAPFPQKILHSLTHYASLLPRPDRMKVDELLQHNDVEQAARECYQAGLTHRIPELVDSYFFYYPLR